MAKKKPIQHRFEPKAAPATAKAKSNPLRDRADAIVCALDHSVSVEELAEDVRKLAAIVRDLAE